MSEGATMTTELKPTNPPENCPWCDLPMKSGFGNGGRYTEHTYMCDSRVLKSHSPDYVDEEKQTVLCKFIVNRLNRRAPCEPAPSDVERATKFERDWFGEPIGRPDPAQQAFNEMERAYFISQVAALLAAVQAEERERCAKVCDEISKKCRAESEASDYDPQSEIDRAEGADECAAAIRGQP